MATVVNDVYNGIYTDIDTKLPSLMETEKVLVLNRLWLVTYNPKYYTHVCVEDDPSLYVQYPKLHDMIAFHISCKTHTYDTVPYILNYPNNSYVNGVNKLKMLLMLCGKWDMLTHYMAITKEPNSGLQFIAAVKAQYDENKCSLTEETLSSLIAITDSIYDNRLSECPDIGSELGKWYFFIICYMEVVDHIIKDYMAYNDVILQYYQNILIVAYDRYGISEPYNLYSHRYYLILARISKQPIYTHALLLLQCDSYMIYPTIYKFRSILMCYKQLGDVDGASEFLKANKDMFNRVKKETSVPIMNTFVPLINWCVRKVPECTYLCKLFRNALILYYAKLDSIHYAILKVEHTQATNCMVCMDDYKLGDEVIVCTKCYNDVGHNKCVSKLLKRTCHLCNM